MQRTDQSFNVISTITTLDQWTRTYKHKEALCILPPGAGHKLVVFVGFLHISRPHCVCRIFLDCTVAEGSLGSEVRPVSQRTTFAAWGDPVGKWEALRRLRQGVGHFLLSCLVGYMGEEKGCTETCVASSRLYTCAVTNDLVHDA